MKTPSKPHTALAKIDRYFDEAPTWSRELKELRKLTLKCDLTEEIKWGKPAYTHRGANIAILIPLKETLALMFPKGVLLKDSAGILTKAGENTQAARWVKFTSLKEIVSKKTLLMGLLREAIAAEDAGLKVTFKKPGDFPMPRELLAAFKKNSGLKQAFAALTPGRQRAYQIHFSGAKQAKTRETRIERCTPRILARKGLDD